MLNNFFQVHAKLLILINPFIAENFASMIRALGLNDDIYLFPPHNCAPALFKSAAFSQFQKAIWKQLYKVSSVNIS